MLIIVNNKKNILVIGGIGVDDCYFISKEEYEKRKIKVEKVEKKCICIKDCSYYGNLCDGINYACDWMVFFSEWGNIIFNPLNIERSFKGE